MFKKLSLFQKVIVSVLPAMVGMSFVAWSIYKNATEESDLLAKATKMIRLIGDSELAMVSMSESMRGYLLDPSNKQELEVKEKADDAFGSSMVELSSLLKDEKDIYNLVLDMEKFDEEFLHHSEEEVVNNVVSNIKIARDAYTNKYGPSRKKQNENFLNLKEHVQKKSNQLLKEYELDKKNDAINAILALVGALFLGLVFFFWIMRQINLSIMSASQNIYKSTQQINSSAENLASASQQLASSSQEQASSVEQVSASLEQISGMVGASLKSSQASVDLSKKVSELVASGTQSMSELQSAVHQIAESNERVEKLSKLIEEIGEKTELIDEIVFQTRLLSFNASVEAERAGEHGRGFAVVAQEVGNLAQMSGKSASEITQIVKNSIREAQDVANLNKVKVELGVKLCEKTASHLHEIEVSSKEILSGSEQIYRSSEEQNSGVQQINKSIHLISQGIQENASAAEQCSSNSVNLTDQGVGLSGITRQLQEIVYGKKDDEKKSENILNVVEISEKKVNEKNVKSKVIKNIQGNLAIKDDEWEKL